MASAGSLSCPAVIFVAGGDTERTGGDDGVDVSTIPIYVGEHKCWDPARNV
jgi:hypothetical protein